MKFRPMAALAVLAGLAAQPVLAEEHIVEMLNKGEAGRMVFEPALVRAEVGDTVKFVLTDPLHNAETVEGMLPEGAPMTIGGMNQEITISLDHEGVYGIKCNPHYGMGMVALLVAGDPVNIDEARKVRAPGKSKQRFAALFAELDAQIAGSNAARDPAPGM